MAKHFKFIKYTFFVNFILLAIFSNTSFAGNLRKMYFSYTTYAHSNLPNPALEGVISIKNASNYKQRILPATDISLQIFSYTNQGLSNTILKTPTLKKVSSAGAITNIANLSDFVLNTKETLLMIYSISPTINGGVLQSTNSTYLGQSLLSGTATNVPVEYTANGNDYGGGDYMGYILFQGSITVDDVSDSGFVNASGAIIKPSSRGPLNTADTANFKINNQVPF
jgi:hypothetical protein